MKTYKIKTYGSTVRCEACGQKISEDEAICPSCKAEFYEACKVREEASEEVQRKLDADKSDFMTDLKQRVDELQKKHPVAEDEGRSTKTFLIKGVVALVTVISIHIVIHRFFL